MKQVVQSILIILSLFILGCTTSGHRYINIDPPPFGSALVPEQVDTFLKENNFTRISFSARVRDLNSDATDALNKKTGMVLDSRNKLLMRYQHQNYSALLLNVSVNKDKGNVEFDFFENDKNELSPESMNIYEQLKENLGTRLYDKDNFSER